MESREGLWRKSGRQDKEQESSPLWGFHCHTEQGPGWSCLLSSSREVIMERESRAASADREGELNWLPCPGEQGRQLPSWPGLEGEGPGLESVDSFEALVVSGHRALLPSFCCLHQPPPYLRVGSRIRRRPPRASVSPSIQCGLVTPHWVVVRTPDLMHERPSETRLDRHPCVEPLATHLHPVSLPPFWSG